MTLTDEYEALFTAVCECPEDWDRRRILADWFEDQGRVEEAACMRWTADNRKRALGGSSDVTWYHAEGQKDNPNSANLPDKLFIYLDKHDNDRRSNECWWRDYPTPRKAEEALIRAWLASRKAEWNPDDAGT